LKRWEDHIKVDLSEVGCENNNCPEVAQNKVHYWACVINDVELSDFVTAEFFLTII
jgi:hypothetical protein